VPITGRGRKFTDITEEVQNFVAATDVKSGLLTLFIQHTSASLLIQENADPDVLKDLDDAFARLAPRNANYRHRTEGPDDMPSHIRAALTQTSLSIPITNGAPVLGTWQAIYLFEHRDAPHHRTVVMHVIGE
jgi:secondary thiamine-phosphate synthase enzyme